jgi:hypothetical protein
MNSAIDEAAETETETARRQYFRLLALSEAPQGKLRAPREQWNDAERIAADVLELLGLLGATLSRYDDAAVCARLALVTPGQVLRYDAALQAIGELQQRRILGTLQRRLLAPAMEAGPAHRAFVVAVLRHANKRLIVRLKYEISIDQLQQGLCRYLEIAANASLPELPPPEAPHTSLVAPRAPEASLRVDPGRGPQHLFLLRDAPATTRLLDAWIASRPATRRFDEHLSRPVASYTEALRMQPTDRSRRTSAENVLGELRPGGVVPDSLYSRRLSGSDPSMTALADRMTANFHWALVRWAWFKEEIFAWISDDAECADRFAALLEREEAAALITAYRHVDLREYFALGLAFGEYDASRNSDGCGEVGLVAADGDDVAPWLVLAVRHEQGYWWCIASARLPVHAWHWTSDLGRDVALIVYRGSDLDAWRELWSRLGADDNVAVLAVDGRIPIEVLRERLVRTKDTVCIDNLRYLAGDGGWAYGHIWGGGSDEHYALFFARDPAVTARVAAFARERWPESWRWHNCW